MWTPITMRAQVDDAHEITFTQEASEIGLNSSLLVLLSPQAVIVEHSQDIEQFLYHLRLIGLVAIPSSALVALRVFCSLKRRKASSYLVEITINSMKAAIICA